MQELDFASARQISDQDLLACGNRGGGRQSAGGPRSRTIESEIDLILRVDLSGAADREDRYQEKTERQGGSESAYTTDGG